MAAAANARLLASLLVKQAAVSQISSAKIKKRINNYKNAVEKLDGIFCVLKNTPCVIRREKLKTYPIAFDDKGSL